MSTFVCYALHRAVQADLPLPPPAAPVEEVVYQAPATQDLLSAVGHVFGSAWIWGQACRLGLQHDLDDAHQTTFCRAWQARDHFDPQYPLTSWVGRIARNVLIDMARSRGRRWAISLFDDEGGQRFDPPGRQPAALDVLIAREQNERLEAALAQASPLVREILTLKEQGLTFAEIGRQVGKSHSAVVSAFHRFKVATLENVLSEA